ncbi:MAG: MCE family protein [Gemmatimonadales bacterium]|nr:MAG: MCE family protein [Gemmatimonadales bacterium]
MSIRANPTAIGLFMIGAAALAILGVFTLASRAWFGDRPTFISYFQESVNGLERGAAVKFQGVPVGTVSELLIQIDQVDKTFLVPVEYEIDLRRLTTEIGEFLHLNDEEVLERQITDGLRAQLQMESLVTGILYIELTYRPDASPPRQRVATSPHPEIPTTPSLLAAFGTEAGSLVADVLQILFRVNEILEEVDMQELNTAVVASAQAVERLVGSPELQAAIDEVPGMARQFGSTLAEFEELGDRLGEAIGPLQLGMEETLTETTLTLKAARETIEGAKGLITTDSGIGHELEQTLTSLREAAEALRTLVITLERNPDMLLRGTNPPDSER